jgi:hypothetical protein
MKNKIDGKGVLYLDGSFKKLTKNKEEQKENRFTYSDNSGLKLLTEKEILDSIDNKSKETDTTEKDKEQKKDE